MKKHALYKLFSQSTYDTLVKILKHSGDREELKDLTKHSCFSLPAFFLKNQAQYGALTFPSSGVDVTIFATEYLWATSGRTVIYPRSQAEVNVISNSSFKGLDLKYTSGELMVIGSPPDSDMPPMLAGCLTGSDAAKFNAFFNTQIGGINPQRLDLQVNIFITVYFDKNSGTYLAYEVAERDLPAYANASTQQEIIELMEAGELLPDSVLLTKADRETQARLVKLALNFWMYKICSPDKFIKQTPPVHSRDNYGKAPTGAYSLSFADRFKGSSEGRISEVGIHMRNLRDERFYSSPEWRDKPRGSRWIEIGPYTRGGKGVMLDEPEAVVTEN